ncbi:HNH endonuclease family protein [Vibrio campbellii]|nr:hypothetical protein [Vibrio campbellii]
MRYVDRSQVKRPSCLDFNDSSSKARQELSRNVNAKKRSFKCYKDNSVKLALERLFHGKCAYCESKYDSHQPMDIEHYRPKNSKKYWWLAAVWENLLPSCIDCNRVRGHKHFDAKTRKIIGLDNSGKGECFPLFGTMASPPKNFNKVSNASMNMSIAVESPVLLNPTLDNVEVWLSYTDEAALFPSEEAMRDPSILKRVNKSISTLGLNRIGLVSSRNVVLLNLESLIYMVKKIVPLLKDDLTEHHKALLHELLVYIFRHIKTFEDEKHPYSLMCKQVIRKKLGPIVR